MIKKRKFILKGVLILSSIYTILFSSCFSLGNKTVVPTGLLVDQDNCAYIKGPILAVDGNKISGVFLSEPSIMVPAGKELTVSVSCNLGQVDYVENRTITYQANQEFTLPPLEKDKNYYISVDPNDDLFDILLLTECTITLMDITTRAGELKFSQSKAFNPPVKPQIKSGT